MATLLLPHPNPKLTTFQPQPKPKPKTITCGPRDNRGPLQRGRSLSSEAIHAVQSLKRLTAGGAAASSSSSAAAAAASLGRLLKPDLLAAMAELQRQGHWALAVAALSVARSEPWYRPDASLYAAFVSSSPDAAAADVDELVDAFLAEKASSGGFFPEDDVYKVTRLVRALVAKGRGEAAWRVYEAAVRRGGCEPDEYLFRVLVRGLKRLGLEEAAAEVERDFRVWETTVSPPARSVR